VIWTARPKRRNLDFQLNLLSCLRPVPRNDALQFAPDEAGTTAILPGGELIDCIQNIAGNIADRQYLNSRLLSPCLDSSGVPTSLCPQIRLSSPFPAISAASVVIIFVIFIYFLHVSHLFLRERRRKVSKKV
jgi:hypothetical protein